MAGDWIKWCKGFGRKPEVIAMANQLNTTRKEVSTACMELFEWLDTEGQPDNPDDPNSDITVTFLSRKERDTSRVLTSHVDDVSGLPGMSDALLATGWIEFTETGIIFKRAGRHNSETAKKRALATKRQQKRRASHQPEPSRAERDNCHAENVTREEKRRDIDNTNVLSCSEPSSTASEPAILVFPTTGKGAKSWALTQSKVYEYEASYPGMDILAEFRSALQWCRDNPARRKTAKGMPAFLTRWLSRKQDRGQTIQSANGQKKPEAPNYLN